MKAKTRHTFRRITVEYRYSASIRNGFVTAVDHNIAFDNKRTITLDRYSGVLTVREKGRFAKEKTRFLTPEQLHEIIIFVHTRKRNILNDKKTATVQIFDKIKDIFSYSGDLLKLLFIQPVCKHMEFATIFKLLDTKVTVVEMLPTILPNEEPEVGEFLLRNFRKEGMEVFVNSRVTEVKKVDEGVEVKIQSPNEEIVKNVEKDPPGHPGLYVRPADCCE